MHGCAVEPTIGTLWFLSSFHLTEDSFCCDLWKEDDGDSAAFLSRLRSRCVLARACVKRQLPFLHVPDAKWRHICVRSCGVSVTMYGVLAWCSIRCRMSIIPFLNIS